MTQAAKAPLGAPPPALDLSGYRVVVIQKAGDANGRTFRRGQTVTVDAATLDALKAGGMVDGDGKPAS